MFQPRRSNLKKLLWFGFWRSTGEGPAHRHETDKPGGRSVPKHVQQQPLLNSSHHGPARVEILCGTSAQVINPFGLTMDANVRWFCSASVSLQLCGHVRLMFPWCRSTQTSLVATMTNLLSLVFKHEKDRLMNIFTGVTTALEGKEHCTRLACRLEGCSSVTFVRSRALMTRGAHRACA